MKWQCNANTLIRNYKPVKTISSTNWKLTQNIVHKVVHKINIQTWWRIILFSFKIIKYGVSWLRKVSEIPTGH